MLLGFFWEPITAPRVLPPLITASSPHPSINRAWNKRVDYEPGTGSKQLFPKMHLETCGGPLSSVRTTVELQTSHIGKGCDRETYSEKSLQKLCGRGSRARCMQKQELPVEHGGWGLGVEPCWWLGGAGGVWRRFGLSSPKHLKQPSLLS
ncbi:hypothetical protein CRUP_031193 [Coryphaenoides rupestris]|nr:hypothetical protein CRUP_031193 [Coryphaenoides rupestris]